MTKFDLAKLFPKASAEFLALNSDPALVRKKDTATIPLPADKKASTGLVVVERVIRDSSLKRLHLFISGQVVGGKNNMIVLRNGVHIPKKNWATWRDAKVKEVSDQLPCGWTPISSYAAVHMDYVAGDKRRRDQPATIDSIWHVLEKAGVVTDDTHLWVEKSTRTYSKERPGVSLTIIYER